MLNKLVPRHMTPNSDQNNMPTKIVCIQNTDYYNLTDYNKYRLL